MVTWAQGYRAQGSGLSRASTVFHFLYEIAFPVWKVFSFLTFSWSQLIFTVGMSEWGSQCFEGGSFHVLPPPTKSEPHLVTILTNIPPWDPLLQDGSDLCCGPNREECIAAISPHSPSSSGMWAEKPKAQHSPMSSENRSRAQCFSCLLIAVTTYMTEETEWRKGSFGSQLRGWSLSCKESVARWELTIGCVHVLMPLDAEIQEWN